MAARTDPELRSQVLELQARLGREVYGLALELLDVDDAEPGVKDAVQATLDLVRGLALANQLADDGKRRAHVVRYWAKMLEEQL